MNCRRETVKMGVPSGNRAQRRRLRRVQGVDSEPYLGGMSQEEPVLSEVQTTPEDARKDGPIRGRSR